MCNLLSVKTIGISLDFDAMWFMTNLFVKFRVSQSNSLTYSSQIIKNSQKLFFREFDIFWRKSVQSLIDPKQSEEKYYIGFRSQCDLCGIYFVQLPKTVAHTSKFLEYFSWMCWFMVEICSNLVRNLREIEILVTKCSGRGKIRIF